MGKNKRSGFSGGIGFILAAAASAVGLGNLWRFPYLAAKDGGGVFLLAYVILAITFGFTLLITEIAIGRKTKLSSIGAYKAMHKKFAFLGPVSALVPVLIFPYYCVIGGWILKYAFAFLTGDGAQTVAPEYFSGFIDSFLPPIFWCAIFLGVTVIVVFFGVEKGVERFSKILMPVLCVLIVGIAVFSLTLKDGTSGRTAIDGLKVYLIPDFKDITLKSFFRIVLDAMGQVFYSLSIAMGIMITYGSYLKKDVKLEKSVAGIEFFDLLVAFFAGVIMIPTVFAFQGKEGLNAAGPSLLFISMPKVFDRMGFAGAFVGALFFVLVLFAALTSSVSLMEAVVSMIMDKFHCSRKKAAIITVAGSAILALASCFGYNIWYFELKLPNGVTGQLLDVFDYITNSLLMPIIAIATCLLSAWFCKPKTLIDEIKYNNAEFKREFLYVTMLKYIAPICLIFIFASSLGLFGFLN